MTVITAYFDGGPVGGEYAAVPEGAEGSVIIVPYVPDMEEKIAAYVRGDYPKAMTYETIAYYPTGQRTADGAFIYKAEGSGTGEH